MKSDHWNFLANLLGAPGAAEPPAQPPKPAPVPKKEDKPAAASVTPQQETAARPIEATAPERLASSVSGTQPGRTDAPRATSKNDPLGFSSFRDLDDEPAVKKESTEIPPPSRREPETSTERGGSSQPTRSTEHAAAASSKESAFSDDSETLSGEDVLQALTAVTPPPRLPGFGVSNVPEAVEPAKKEPSMWGRIAGKFGVGSERKPEQEEESPRDRPRTSTPPPVAEKPSAGPARSGFGSGLVDANEDDKLPVQSSRDTGSRDTGSRDSNRDTAGGRERTRRSIALTGDDEASESPEVLPLPGSGDEESTGRSSRRRGRRGIRQRIGEDDLDRPDATPEAREDKPRQDETRERGGRRDVRSSEREGSSRHAGSSRKEGSSREVSSSRDEGSSRESSSSQRDADEGRGRGRNRDRSSSQNRDRGARGGRGPNRQRDDADLPAHDDAFVGDDLPIEMDAEFDEVGDDDFGTGVVGEVRGETDAADDESSSEPRARSRRRGRRGRRRGGAESTPPSARVEPDDLDDDDLGDEDEIVEATFDDDHEDDEEVEEIRRGSHRRPRSRSRRPARSENGEAALDPAAGPKGSEPRPSREAGARDVEFDDVDEVTDDDGNRRRSSAPTWLETVELLVNANIENHNRGGSKSQRGGRGGGRRR